MGVGNRCDSGSEGRRRINGTDTTLKFLPQPKFGREGMLGTGGRTIIVCVALCGCVLEHSRTSSIGHTHTHTNEPITHTHEQTNKRTNPTYGPRLYSCSHPTPHGMNIRSSLWTIHNQPPDHGSRCPPLPRKDEEIRSQYQHGASFWTKPVSINTRAHTSSVRFVSVSRQQWERKET